MVNIMIRWMMTGIVAMFHPFFISVVDVNHNAKDATVEISVRIFTDDLEKTLQKYTPTKIDLTAPVNKAFVDKQISNYLAQKIKLKINGLPVHFNYLGYEIQKESSWCYLEIEKVPVANRIDVDCNLLYDFETSQTNMLHVKSKGVEKSYKLDYPKTTAGFEF